MAADIPTYRLIGASLQCDVLEGRRTSGEQLFGERLRDERGMRVVNRVDTVGEAEGEPNAAISLPVANPKLWSPAEPYLYRLEAGPYRATKRMVLVK